MYEKHGSAWDCVLETNGIVGKNGVSDKSREGDYCTPKGIFSLGFAFGTEPMNGLDIEYKGKELIKVVPDEVKSAKLTAEWESRLQQIEHGELPEAVFMSGIQQYIAEMCSKYGSADKSVSLSDGGNEPIGKCPKCGADVVKGKFGFYCKDKCGMNIAKVYGVELSDAQVKGLLDGKSTSYTCRIFRTD